MLRNVKSFDLKGQRILLRLDLNVPLNKNNLIEDNFRIRATTLIRKFNILYIYLNFLKLYSNQNFF